MQSIYKRLKSKYLFSDIADSFIFREKGNAMTHNEKYIALLILNLVRIGTNNRQFTIANIVYVVHINVERVHVLISVRLTASVPTYLQTKPLR